MSFRTTLFLLVSLIVLILAYVFVSGSYDNPASATEMFSSRDVQSLESMTLNDDLSMTQEDGVWKLEGKALDGQQIESFLHELQEHEKGQLVSKNPDNWPQYGLSEGFQTIAFEGGPIDTLVLGSAAPGGLLYVRYDDAPEVYASQTRLMSFLRYDRDRWLSKALFTDEVIPTRITARVGDEKWEMVKTDSVWKVDGSEVEEQAVVDYWTSIQGLKGSSFESDVSLFGEADNALAVVGENGNEIVVTVDVQDDQGSLVQVSGREELLRFSHDLSSRIRPSFLESTESDMLTAPDSSL